MALGRYGGLVRRRDGSLRLLLNGCVGPLLKGLRDLIRRRNDLAWRGDDSLVRDRDAGEIWSVACHDVRNQLRMNAEILLSFAGDGKEFTEKSQG